ncbi:archaetidylserine decarboxylase [Microcoleus sp. B7-D4]|uniref:archaetidylserine decarboxylase n=1 Tax=Microcoleus sp. B7-D4 TaxID=2818696 RepID=UPI002FD069EC
MSPARTNLCYRDRQTGAIVTEPIFAETTLRWFYETVLGFQVLNVFLNNRVFCSLYGWWQNSPSTCTKIPEFVSCYGINLEEVELSWDCYPSFNAFFSRRLKPGVRPFVTQSEIFCSPCDGKVLVYPQLQDDTLIPIKGSSISIASLLDSEVAAQPYVGGSALVIRLAPYDYHRFHFPDDGKANLTKAIKGEYHSVNPIALARVPGTFCRNKRTVTDFNSKHFGRIAYIEIGALTVASIVQTYTPACVKKGQEKGYFQYGGSTLVLLFEPKSITFDSDLIKDSANGLEVHVLTGSQLGKQP